MKNIILIFAMLALMKASAVQLCAMECYGRDAKGNTDSVKLVTDDATLGIDEKYVEQNIYGTPYKELDLRSVIRVSMLSWESYAPKYMIYNRYGFNQDLKTDYRRINILNDSLKYFRLYLHAKNYPVDFMLNKLVNCSFDFVSCIVHDGFLLVGYSEPIPGRSYVNHYWRTDTVF